MNMHFGQAIEIVKARGKVRRASEQTPIRLRVSSCNARPSIYMGDALWAPSQDDMLADDWEEVA